MNVQHRLTTALQMAFALMWRDPFSVNVNQDLQGMEKHARVGQKQNNKREAVFRVFFDPFPPLSWSLEQAKTSPYPSF